MASFVDMLNQGFGALNTPLGQFGTQMLLASGPQANNPSLGNRLGQAFQGMGQQQLQQQQLEQTNLLRQVQQATLLRQAKQMQQEEERRTKVQELVQDPSFMANNPMARQIIGAIGDFGMAADLAKLEPGVKPPTMKQTYDQYNPDGTVTQQIYDYDTGGYKQGATYTPTAQQRVALEQEYRPQELAVKQQTAGAAQQNAQTAMAKVELARTAQEKEWASSLRKNNIEAETLRQGYTGANTQMSEVIDDIDRLVALPGFNSLFGPNGMITPIPGTQAADAKAAYDQLTNKLTLSEVKRLSDMGVKLNPMSNLDLDTIRASATGLNKAMSDVAAKETLTRIRNRLDTARSAMGDNYNRMSSLYGPQQTEQSQQAPQQATIVRTGRDASGRKVVQYSDGRIEYGD